jgi:hypothetical protein
MDTLHKDLCTFMTMFRSILCRMRDVSDKIVEKLKTHIFLFSNFFFQNRDVYEIM